MAQDKSEKPSAGSKAAWGKLGVHTVTCPSGMTVKMRIPNLQLLIRQDRIPGKLMEVALRESLGQPILDQVRGGGEAGNGSVGDDFDLEKAKELISQGFEFQRWLVTEAVVEPKVTVEDLDAGLVPEEDAEMLSALAQRIRFTDAKGVRLGVMPLDAFEEFRREHGCPPDCPSCAALQNEFSSVGVV